MKIGQKRKNAILQKIEEESSITVNALAESLGVAEMTIRRYLTELQNEGLLKRVHGGAVRTPSRSYEPPYSLRSAQANVAKAHIGKLAAQLIEDGDTVALDVGSTTFEIAKALTARSSLTVITPSMRVLNLLMGNPDIRLISPGGVIRPGEESMIGELPRQAFKGLYVDKLFLGVGGLDSQAGLTEYNWDDALIKQAMIACAKEVYLVTDAGKFEQVAFAKVAELRSIHTLITDQMPPATLALALADAGVKVTVAAPAKATPTSQQLTKEEK